MATTERPRVFSVLIPESIVITCVALRPEGPARCVGHTHSVRDRNPDFAAELDASSYKAELVFDLQKENECPHTEDAIRRLMGCPARYVGRHEVDGIAELGARVAAAYLYLENARDRLGKMRGKDVDYRRLFDLIGRKARHHEVDYHHLIAAVHTAIAERPGDVDRFTRSLPR